MFWGIWENPKFELNSERREWVLRDIGGPPRRTGPSTQCVESMHTFTYDGFWGSGNLMPRHTRNPSLQAHEAQGWGSKNDPRKKNKFVPP